MTKIEIYTKEYCPYCEAAKSLLRAKGVDYLEKSLTESPELREEMMRRANGRHTVPQIFVDDIALGGFDDIALLDEQGKLDQLLAHHQDALV